MKSFDPLLIEYPALSLWRKRYPLWDKIVLVMKNMGWVEQEVAMGER